MYDVHCINETYCGTLRDASFLALVYLLRNYSDVEIIFKGFNRRRIIEYNDIAQDNYNGTGTVNVNPCLPNPFVSIAELDDEFDGDTAVTITFDPNYIKSMEDWYPIDLCERNYNLTYGESFFLERYLTGAGNGVSITVNNLIFENYVFDGDKLRPYYIAYLDTFICNNCIFSNIMIGNDHYTQFNNGSFNKRPALISGGNIVLRNCRFSNITYQTIANGQEFFFIFVDSVRWTENIPRSYDFSFTLSESDVNNINGMDGFIYFHPVTITTGEVIANIKDTKFEEISTPGSIIKYHTEVVPTSSHKFNIIDCAFLNINLGSILRAYSNYGSTIFTLNNINITTAQTIESYLDYQQLLEREEIDYYSLLIWENEDDIVYINHMNVMYLYADNIYSYCVDNNGDPTYSTYLWYTAQMTFELDLGFLLLSYHCEYPIQLIDNVAYLQMVDISAANDITHQIINEYKSFITREVENFASIVSRDNVYIEFNYNLWIDDIYGLIYNHGKGELNLIGMKVYGSGVHDAIIYNPDGILSVENLISIPDTYCAAGDHLCEYDPDTLKIQFWILFNGANAVCSGTELRVSHSYLFGANAQAIVIGGGEAYIHNVTIEKSTVGLVTNPAVTYLEIVSSQFIDIGTWYSSSRHRLTAYNPVYVPMVFTAQDILIQDCVFAYVSPYQFEIFDSTGYYARITSSSITVRKTVKLINNIFEINDINVLYTYPSNESSLWLTEAADTHDTLSDLTSQHFVMDGIMPIPNGMDLTMINNQFDINQDNHYVDESTLIEYDLPWIYVQQDENGTDSEVCMSGNEFINYAIYLEEGSITSCVKRELLNYIHTDNCSDYGTFGSISTYALELNQRRPNIFDVYYPRLKSIIEASENTYFALDNTQINVYGDGYNILMSEEGNILLVDTIINGSDEYRIELNNDCEIHCYSVLNDAPNFIPALDVECSDVVDNETSLIDDLVEAEFRSHFSPNLIIVSTINDSTYFPSDRLKLVYSVFDVYGNEIQNVGQYFAVNFESVSTSQRFEINIDENGKCVECESGILFPGITLDDVGQTITFSGSVNNNAMIIDHLINITIIPCPSAFGSNNNQCDLCSRGYFSLLPSNDSCYYCNQADLDGIACEGGDTIIIDYNYWIMTYKYQSGNAIDNAALFTQNEYILSALCPNDYCCQKEQGCNFVQDSDELCAANRNSTAYLCGKCLDGYSEVFGTTNCSECTRDYIERLLLPIFYGFLLTMFIFFVKSRKVDTGKDVAEKVKISCCKKHCRCCFEEKIKPNNSKGDDIDAKPAMQWEEYRRSAEKMLTKVITYYYQSVGYILTTTGIQSSLYGFVELFNLNVFTAISWGSNGNQSDDGYCLFKNMTMPQKLLIQLTSSASILFFILMFYLLNRIASINLCKPLKRNINYGQSLLTALLICIGQVLSIMFQLLACRNIGEYKSVHYFFGSEECYGAIWIGSLISLITMILSFSMLFVVIWFHQRSRKQCKTKENQRGQLYYYPVIGTYKDEYWYWELVMFIRRLLFALVFIVFDDNNLKISMGVLLLIYSFIHQHYLPFRWKYVNKLDSYLIASITAIIFMDANSANTDTGFYSFIISLLILFPIIWFIWFLIANRRACKNKKGRDGPKIVYDVDEQDGDGLKWETTVKPESNTAAGMALQIQNTDKHQAVPSKEEYAEAQRGDLEIELEQLQTVKEAEEDNVHDMNFNLEMK